LRIAVFISIFLTLYGLIHSYAFLKVRYAFSLSRWGSISLALLMTFMVLCPILIRVLERYGMHSVPKVLAYAGYTWMGLLFLFVCTALIIDVYALLLSVIARISHWDPGQWMPSSRVTFFIPLAVAVFVGIYGQIEALHIRTERIVIKSPKIPEKLGRLRIVQISDVHLGLIIGEWRLERILKEVRRAQPDILVSTGDLLDGQINDISRMADKIGAIRTPYGKYAVTGNHEFYAGIGRSLAFTEEAGFTVLRGEKREIPGLIVMAGVDDATTNLFGSHERISEKELLSDLPEDRFVVLLKHRPLVESGCEGLFDLQLSGHTHGGQIFPFSLIIKLLYPIDRGLLPLRDGAFLYVNRGSGTWGPPMRFLVPPEVSIIDLVHGR
jgi:uncharacterized protein